METRGCPLPLNLLIRHLLAGESYSAEVSQAVRRELYGYFDELVYSRLDLATRRLVMELAPFEPFSAELARLLSGSSRAGEMLDKFQSVTSELLPKKADTWRFWPVFRNYLLWKFDNEYDGEKRRALYYRCGLYYELREEYKLALECYSKSGSSDKVMELLMRNAELHPGAGHYDEMEPYYRQLPEREILGSPALIQAMSMLCAISMDYEGSERWYKALSDFASSRRKADMAAKEARSRLAWLDIALPQRSVDGLPEVFTRSFKLMRAKEIKLPEFSVTSCLPRGRSKATPQSPSATAPLAQGSHGTRSKPPLRKGRWHGEAVTEGSRSIARSVIGRPLSRLRRQLPLRRGAMGRAQSLPCAKGGVAAKP